MAMQSRVQPRVCPCTAAHDRVHGPANRTSSHMPNRMSRHMSTHEGKTPPPSARCSRPCCQGHNYISALSRRRRRHVHCAGIGVLVLKMTASECRRRCRERADIELCTSKKWRHCARSQTRWTMAPESWWLSTAFESVDASACGYVHRLVWYRHVF